MPTTGHFSPRAQRVLRLAEHEARELGHGYLGTEHLLLGLIREREGPVAKALAGMGIDIARARAALVAVAGPTPPATEQWTGRTPAANDVLKTAILDSIWLDHHYNGTEHILLALLKIETCVAIDMLRHLGADEDALADAAIAASDPHRDEHIANPAIPWDDRFPQPELPPEQDPLRFGWLKTMKRFARVRGVVNAVCLREADRLNHDYIGTEHALLGILASGDLLTTSILARWGVTWEQAAAAVDEVIGRGDGDRLEKRSASRRLFRIKSALVAESELVGQALTGYEHLLRHLLSHEHGAAISVLRQLGVDVQALHAQMVEIATLPAPIRTVVEPDSRPERREREDELFDLNGFILRAYKMKAREQAKRLHHDTIGTEHLLLGIVHLPDRSLWKLLPELGLTRAGTRHAVEELFPRGDGVPGAKAPTSRHFRRALARADRERQQQGCEMVECCHVLLALLDDESCRAFRVMDRMGIDRELFRDHLNQLGKTCAPDPA